ncbi:hypothetical protein D5086_010751 [Populus alba]|uniref:Uncharacterized protein n=1 Tax=Populus alba TaxID=43335 RepID=A0ACC4CBN8_POPAL
MRPCHMLRRSVAFGEPHEDKFWNPMLEDREIPPVAPFEVYEIHLSAEGRKISALEVRISQEKEGLPS